MCVSCHYARHGYHLNLVSTHRTTLTTDITDLLKRAGFTEEEAQIRTSRSKERPRTTLTQLMDNLRAECGKLIFASAKIKVTVSITQVSRGNNFDIEYGEKGLRVITEGGELAFIDKADFSIIMYLDTTDLIVAAERVLKYMIDGKKRLHGGYSDSDSDSD